MEIQPGRVLFTSDEMDAEADATVTMLHRICGEAEELDPAQRDGFLLHALFSEMAAHPGGLSGDARPTPVVPHI